MNAIAKLIEVFSSAYITYGMRFDFFLFALKHQKKADQRKKIFA